MADAARFSIGGDEQGLQYHRVCTAHSPCIPCRCLRSFESPDPAPCMRVRALEIGGSGACVRACTGRGLRTDNLLASWFRFCSNTCSCLPKFQLSRSNPYRIRKGFNTMRPAQRSPRRRRPAPDGLVPDRREESAPTIISRHKEWRECRPLVSAFSPWHGPAPQAAVGLQAAFCTVCEGVAAAASHGRTSNERCR